MNEMLELNFEVFMDHYEKQSSNRSDQYRRLHYLEEDDQFTLYLKSPDYWEYYTTISIDNIIAFGEKYGADRERAIKDFKVNFLTGAMGLKKPDAPEVVEEPVMEVVEDEVITKEVDAGPEMEEQADTYESFLENKFAAWESQLLSFIDSTMADELVKDVTYVEKSFGDFLARLFNVVNTSGFVNGLRAVIKAELKTGIDAAEQELKVDVGFGAEFNQDVTTLADRQIEGFYIEGKRWQGLKGVADDVQQDVSQAVRDAIVGKQSRKELRENIQDIMGTTKTRATTIARTESNRFHNHAKLKTYEASGLDGKKVWDSFFDNRTSQICEELNGQAVGINETFKTEKGQEFMIPPAHPNCRSVIRFELD